LISKHPQNILFSTLISKHSHCCTNYSHLHDYVSCSEFVLGLFTLLP